MHHFIQTIKKYWFEILIIATITLFPLLWKQLKDLLKHYGLSLPIGFYLICEIFYDITAFGAVYHLGFLQSLSIKIKKGVNNKEYIHPFLLPIWLVKIVVFFIGDLKQELKHVRIDVRKIRVWFRFNRIVALIQPIVTSILVLINTTLPLIVGIIVYGFLFADLLSTIVLIIETEKRLRKRENKVIIELAHYEHLEGIVKVDQDRYEEVDHSITATREMMESRIRICNYENNGWFWIAKINGEIVGILVLQPTNKHPEDFISWHESTDNGYIQKTFQRDGKNIYVVAATTKHNAPNETFDLLIAHGIQKWVETKKEIAYFCSRMPDFHRHCEKMSANDYYNAKIIDHGKAVALDRQIRMYEKMGFKKTRLVENGFKGDKESLNYGVVFYAQNLFSQFPLPLAKCIGKCLKKIISNRFLMKFVI